MFRFFPAATFFLTAMPLMAEVGVGSLFQDHLVLQRDQAVPVWGTAEVGEKVTVSVAGVEGSATAGADGRWMVRLPAMRGGGPHVMRIEGTNVVELKDVMVGEVWLCSGQSNMDFTMASTEKRSYAGVRDAEEEIAAANHPQIRQFSAEWTMRDEPQDSVAGEWAVCSPNSAGDFSAVGYFFARKLSQELKVAVGIINCSYGASTCEAWMSREAVEGDEALRPLWDAYQKKREEFSAKPDALAAYEAAHAKWSEAFKERGRAAGRAPKHPDPVQDQHHPSVLFNGMIAPVLPYGVRGAVWYQGESNTGNTAMYAGLQQALVKDWRARWGQDRFAFHAVLLAGFHAPKPEPAESRLASFRESQCAILNLPDTGIVSAVDVGDEKDVHPRNKQDVGLRLALSALERTYQKPVVGSGPMWDGVELEGERMRLRFRNVGGGLMSRGGALKGFAVCGKDGRFRHAEARIEGDTVVVFSAEVKEPVKARYAWADHPVGANLYSAAGLPAFPFRTDGPGFVFPEVKGREKSVVFLVGDSTVRNHTARLAGWGDPFKGLVEPAKAEVMNRALGGRSSRSYLREGLWEKVRTELRAGDVVIIQLGHNEGGPMDRDRARASIKGVGDDTTDVVVVENGSYETVRSYGWYIRRYVREAKAAGAHPIVCSLVARNIWEEGKVVRASETYGLWAKQVAEGEGVPFIDLNGITATAYERMGEEKVRAAFFLKEDHTHTTPEGAAFTAGLVAQALAEVDGGRWRDWVK
jgi:sialate O-acetylesterase